MLPELALSPVFSWGVAAGWGRSSWRQAQQRLGAGTPAFWGPCRRDVCRTRAWFFSMVMTTADVLGTEGAQRRVCVWGAGL